MAKLNGNKNFRGLVGTVIISSWRGIDYIKHKGRKSTKPPTLTQLIHRHKIGLISTFIYSMNRLLERTFTPYAVGMTGANAAFSFNFKNAIKGSHPDCLLDYSRIKVSRGDLPNVSNPNAMSRDNGQMQFTWTNNSGTGHAAPADKIIGVLHFPGLNKVTRHYEDGFKRKDETASLDLSNYIGNPAECWIIVISEDEKEVADSIYLGRHIIQ